MTDLVEQLIAEEEGRERCAYQDSQGLWTIGIGCLVDKRKNAAGLCDAAIDAQFAHDSATARGWAAAIPGWSLCNDVQQAVIVSMCFQLGQLHDWPFFRAALARGDFAGAEAAGQQSEWFRQTPARAKRELNMLRTGQWQDKT